MTTLKCPGGGVVWYPGGGVVVESGGAGGGGSGGGEVDVGGVVGAGPAAGALGL